MEDDKKVTQSVDTATADNNEGKAGKTFTQEEVNKLVGNTRTEEREKSEKAVKDAVAEAIAEYERKAKLTEEEREKEAKSKYEAELKARENEITLRERRIQAQEMLAEKKIPTELVDFVIDIDETKTKNNIEKLIKTYNSSVELGVTDKLKGTPPKDFSNNQTEDKKPIATAF